MADDVRAIAFYLPQYYPTAENDAWWGKGFTEWTKVVEGRPLFHGHYQPQLPADLGFYDLRVPEARQAQAQLARQYGIHGFCYYHYWLDGRRLLDRPFAEVLASGKPDFPFCLCWANHNWTRRWDGLNSEVLIAQNHTLAGDRAMIRELMPAFRDPRYIRVRGRPLFLVYRASELSDPRAVALAWREEAVAAGLPGLYLVRAEVHDDAHTQQDPAQIGFDAAYEFPPHGIRVAKPSSATPGLDPAFSGLAYEYAEVARDFATRPTPNYRRFHAVMPSWDNTARVGRRAHMAVNSSPEAYRSWLEIVCEPHAPGAGGRRAAGVHQRLERMGRRVPPRARPTPWPRVARGHSRGPEWHFARGEPTTSRKRVMFRSMAGSSDWPRSSASMARAPSSCCGRHRLSHGAGAPMSPGAMMSSSRSMKSSRISRHLWRSSNAATPIARAPQRHPGNGWYREGPCRLCHSGREGRLFCLDRARQVSLRASTGGG